MKQNQRLSQLVASFFGSRCQGIPLVLFVAWPCDNLWFCFMLIVVESLDSYPVSFYLYSALHLIILLYLLYFIQFSRCNLVLFSTFYVEMSRLVGLSGLEPPTSRLSGECSNRLSYKPILVIIGSSITFATGGDKRDRTVDLLLAKQALFQLS